MQWLAVDLIVANSSPGTAGRDRLREFADGVTDAEVVVLNDSFEDSVSSISQFIRAGGQTFPFLFIDPTGWTGFKLKTISPLLSLDPGEVLINFMTGHIRRFLTEEHSQQSFEALFGSRGFSLPLVWESDLRNWLEDWKRAGSLRLEGLALRERVPKRDHAHFLVWQEEGY